VQEMARLSVAAPAHWRRARVTVSVTQSDGRLRIARIPVSIPRPAPHAPWNPLADSEYPVPE